MTEMKHCMVCGTRLQDKYLPSEGRNIPFCPTCGEFRFPVFNAAVSMIITDPTGTRVLMIRQYGGTEYILCAGYINKGEDAEDAAVREVREELGLDVKELTFNHSHYYAPSNTLMLNFTAVVDEKDARPNEEIDSWAWFDKETARQKIRRGSLAKAFLLGWLDQEYHFPEAPAKPYK